MRRNQDQDQAQKEIAAEDKLRTARQERIDRLSKGADKFFKGLPYWHERLAPGIALVHIEGDTYHIQISPVLEEEST